MAQSKYDSGLPELDTFLYRLLVTFNMNSNRCAQYFLSSKYRHITPKKFIEKCELIFKKHDRETIGKLSKFFRMIDQDDSGVISYKEFLEALDRVQRLYIRQDYNSTRINDSQSGSQKDIGNTSIYSNDFELDESLPERERLLLKNKFLDEPGMQDARQIERLPTFEKKSHRADIFDRLKQDLNWNEDRLLRELSTYDKKNDRILNIRYVIKVLKKLGVQNLTKEDEATILSVAKKGHNKEELFYADLVKKIFSDDDPTGLQGKTRIKSLKELVNHFKEEMMMSGINVKDLFEGIDKNNDQYLTY
jgi:Ca2+-binding EF-hand superfamily protein